MAKKIPQLPADINFTKERILFSGDPLTGKLYRVTYDEVRTLVLKPDKMTVTGNSTYLIAAGNTVEKILISPLLTSNIKIGTTAGGDDIWPETTIGAGTDYPVRVDIHARTNKTLFFTGISSTTTIAIYLGKL
ncbi:MAG: hypothetical protein ACTHMM_17695 [Agriterribacter sp.]